MVRNWGNPGNRSKSFPFFTISMLVAEANIGLPLLVLIFYVQTKAGIRGNCCHYENSDIETYIIHYMWIGLFCIITKQEFLHYFLLPTSFILSFIFWFGWIFLPPVMFLVALIRYHIFDLGWLSTTCTAWSPTTSSF